MAWERNARIRFGESGWTLWVDRAGKRPRWAVTGDQDGVSVEPIGRGHASKKEARAAIASTIGVRIRDLRIAKGMSQEYLAARLGIRAITVSRWERGLHVPTANMIEKVLKVLFVAAQKRSDL